MEHLNSVRKGCSALKFYFWNNYFSKITQIRHFIFHFRAYQERRFLSQLIQKFISVLKSIPLSGNCLLLLSLFVKLLRCPYKIYSLKTALRMAKCMPSSFQIYYQSEYCDCQNFTYFTGISLVWTVHLFSKYFLNLRARPAFSARSWDTVVNKAIAVPVHTVFTVWCWIVFSGDIKYYLEEKRRIIFDIRGAIWNRKDFPPLSIYCVEYIIILYVCVCVWVMPICQKGLITLCWAYKIFISIHWM